MTRGKIETSWPIIVVAIGGLTIWEQDKMLQALLTVGNHGWQRFVKVSWGFHGIIFKELKNFKW